MSVLVVDASVVIKWFVPEIHTASARRLLTLNNQYFAPDLLFAEIASAVCKKVKTGQLSPAEGGRLVADFAAVAVETVPCRRLARDAYALASATGCSVYDAMYLALAVRLETQMITADERLAHALAATPEIARHVRTIQSFADD
ncbi:MAG TPA: type II toxin-antitoxin system VapC family toxin [Terriglobales bacterium]|nr:type II toxin-antitoxin system VapC family toxin [Terriglobales bacterium]